MRAWAYIDWEPGGAAYLAIARSDAPVERLPLTEAALLDLIAQAATALRAGPQRYKPAPPDLIGAFGE